MKENERNQIWFSPEMLERCLKECWFSAWKHCLASDGSFNNMKESYYEWKQNKESYEDQTEEA